MSVNSIVFSPTLGLFILAIWVPWVDKFGAIVGYTSGVATGVGLYLTQKACTSQHKDWIESYFNHRDFSNVGYEASLLQTFNSTPSCNTYLSYLYISVCGLIVSLLA